MILSKILKLARGGTIKSITVDVFDTILLRRTWPEDLAFMRHAAKVLPKVQAAINPAITAYEFYSYRQYARRIWYDAKRIEQPKLPMPGAKPEIALREWFALTLTLLTQKYDATITPTARGSLLAYLIESELETENTELFVNKKLVRTLKKAKKYNVKVYFVSDIYLSTRHIFTLLEQKGIEGVFDGGITSADAQAQKWNGSIFHALTNAFGKSFMLHENIHIGDNKTSDYLAPLQAGYDALHYTTPYIAYIRPLKNFLGNGALRRIQNKQRTTARLALNAHKTLGANKRAHAYDVLTKTGRIFAAPLIYQLDYIINRAALSGERLLFVTSEARTYQWAAERMYNTVPAKNILYAPTLNRKAAMRAFLHTMLHSPDWKQLNNALLPLLNYGEKLHMRQEAVTFLLGKVPHISQLAIQNMSDNAFTSYIQRLVEQQKSGEQNHFTEAITLAKTAFNDTSVKDITIVDVGWAGTVQVFLQSTKEQLGNTQTLRGFYMGYGKRPEFEAVFDELPQGLLLNDLHSPKQRPLFVPELWEYVFTAKFETSTKLHTIHRGLEQGIALFKEGIHIAPDEIWLAAKPLLTRLLTKPTKQEIVLLGTAAIDIGFNDPTHTPMVTVTTSTKRAYATLLRHPKRFLRKVTAQYTWTAGELRWHHMQWLAPGIRAARFLRTFRRKKN